jgi:hypothetical protein
MDLRTDLLKLTQPQREVLYVAYFEGKSYREVASILGIPEGTAKNRLRGALAKLRGFSLPPEGAQLGPQADDQTHRRRSRFFDTETGTPPGRQPEP